MSDTTTLPKRLPVLAAKDICRHSLDGPNGTHCLLGWRRAVTDDPYAKWELRKAMCRVSGWSGLSLFNDSPRNSKSKVAEVWNRAAKALGYVKSGKWWTLPKARAK